jgi:hypothetical protein
LTSIADMVAEMLARGVPHDLVVLAVRAAEDALRPHESGGSRVDTAAEKRRAWDREYRAKQRESGGKSGGIPPDANRSSKEDNK